MLRRTRCSAAGAPLSLARELVILIVLGMSNFVTSAVGRTHLEAQNIVEVNQTILWLPLVLTALVSGLLYSTGTVLFGAAVWRSAAVYKWTGVLYAPMGLPILYLGLDDRNSADVWRDTD